MTAADRLTIAQCHALAAAFLAVHRPALDILPGAYADDGAAVFAYGDAAFPDIQAVGNGPLWVDRLTGDTRLPGSREERGRIDAMTEQYIPADDITTPMIWHARTADGVVGWDGTLTGDAAPVAAIVSFMIADFEPLAVTPTGPEVARDIADELAVFAAIGIVYPAADFSGNLPDLTFGAPDAIF